MSAASHTPHVDAAIAARASGPLFRAHQERQAPTGCYWADGDRVYHAINHRRGTVEHTGHVIVLVRWDDTGWCGAAWAAELEEL